MLLDRLNVFDALSTILRPLVPQTTDYIEDLPGRQKDVATKIPNNMIIYILTGIVLLPNLKLLVGDGSVRISSSFGRYEQNENERIKEQ